MHRADYGKVVVPILNFASLVAVYCWPFEVSLLLRASFWVAPLIWRNSLCNCRDVAVVIEWVSSLRIKIFLTSIYQLQQNCNDLLWQLKSTKAFHGILWNKSLYMMEVSYFSVTIPWRSRCLTDWHLIAVSMGRLEVQKNPHIDLSSIHEVFVTKWALNMNCTRTDNC